VVCGLLTIAVLILDFIICAKLGRFGSTRERWFWSDFWVSSKIYFLFPLTGFFRGLPGEEDFLERADQLPVLNVGDEKGACEFTGSGAAAAGPLSAVSAFYRHFLLMANSSSIASFISGRRKLEFALGGAKSLQVDHVRTPAGARSRLEYVG
jgi:hypothetical protein